MAYNQDNLRRYPHSGKFEGELLLAEYLYSLTLDGVDEEIGEADGFGWYGLLRGDLAPTLEENAKLVEPLNEDERTMLSSLAGVIVSENSQGFFSVTYFDAGEENALTATWEGLAKDYEKFANSELDH